MKSFLSFAASLLLMGCSVNEPTPPPRYSWGLLLSEAAITSELAIQRTMAERTAIPADDRRLRQWAVEAVCCEVASHLEGIIEEKDITCLSGIDQIVITGPLELEFRLEALTQTGLVEKVAVIDGPGISGPEH